MANDWTEHPTVKLVHGLLTKLDEDDVMDLSRLMDEWHVALMDGRTALHRGCVNTATEILCKELTPRGIEVIAERDGD